MVKERKITKKKKDEIPLIFPQETEDSNINKEKNQKVGKDKGGLLPLVYDQSDAPQVPEEKQQEEEISNQPEAPISFTFARPIYLQIHLGNIYTIFGSAIISPANLVNNRAFNDVQTTIKTGFILSNDFIQPQDESTALLCINFRKEEENDLVIKGAVAFYYRPIPISRIKSIAVSDQRIKNQLIETALSNDGGIIPEALVAGKFPDNLKLASYARISNSSNTDNFDKELLHFDKILGCFAYLKNYSFLFANRTLLLSPLSDHYFFAAQAINDAAPLQVRKNDRAVSFYKQLFHAGNEIDNSLLNWLFKRINDNTNFSDKDVLAFGNLLFKTAKSDEFIEAAKDILKALTKSLERKGTLGKIAELIDSDKFSLYLFAILRIYANSNTENKSIARADLPEMVSLSYGEYVFAMLGYFFGYKALRNFDDKFSVADEVLSKYMDTNRRVAIKFELNCLFDYVLIESAYKAAFKSNDSAIDIGFIESNAIKKEYVRKPNLLPDDYIFTAIEVFGKYVYQLKRKSGYEELNTRIAELPEVIAAVSDLGAFCYRNKLPFYFGDLLDIINRKAPVSKFIYFKREDLLEATKAKKINIAELIQKIETSKHYKEL